MIFTYTHPQATDFNPRTLMEITLAAHQFKSKLTLRKGKIEVDPKSLVEMVGLLHAKGNRLEITAEGEDADKAVEALLELAVGSPV
jgi:phosphotransferase system HPr (HPr) family protein